MSIKLHDEIETCLKMADTQIAALHIELGNKDAHALGFPIDYFTRSMMAWLIKKALEEPETPDVLFCNGAFNSSTYLFEVEDGWRAANAIKTLVQDMGDVSDVEWPNVVLPCEIAFLEDGKFKHVYPTNPEGAFERWLTMERINAEAAKLGAFAKRIKNLNAPQRKAQRSVKTPHAKRVAELFHQAEEMRR